MDFLLPYVFVNTPHLAGLSQARRGTSVFPVRVRRGTQTMDAVRCAYCIAGDSFKVINERRASSFVQNVAIPRCPTAAVLNARA